ncbi:LysM peptidoglycan-binding domain-containing protein [Weissella diestrammenae]|uniref:LysM peptidoglycan-binding domain-containing protein n=1 Tax=Weissella diestrammenae TaxID=1162633 RepID=A0A7G9T5Q2_9LACO|nr:LysM peptidoglycan-binding domain-containing protein [Weissella diestrammenae]MCM0582253.1 LysM peptidoglycan-binding domain-containing protein [Weissella diestrammenae]QNN75427.1 LysM peptidoglycan-binding domain-containing protein [Weissella diestrammenae]
MSQQDPNQEKPWDASFEEQDVVKKYSRTANRKKTKRVSLVVGLLLTIILILSFIPVFNYLKELNKPAQTTAVASLSENSTTTSTSKVEKNNSSSKKAASKKDEAKKAASEKAASEKAASEKAASDSEKAASEAAQNTVKLELPSGRPTLFGFAAEHNVSVSDLYNLNPGLTADNYTSWIGKDVKIK